MSSKRQWASSGAGVEWNKYYCTYSNGDSLQAKIKEASKRDQSLEEASRAYPFTDSTAAEPYELVSISG
ncbi:hypothetical protein AB5N19_02414 [Seiridium cardinale]